MHGVVVESDTSLLSGFPAESETNYKPNTTPYIRVLPPMTLIMSKKQLNKKEVLAEIKTRLSEGQKRNEILEELSEVYFEKDTIAKLIAMTPSQATIEKHKSINNILLVLLGITILAKLVIGFILMANISIYALPFALLVPIFSVYFAVEVSKYRGYIYNLLGILTIAGMLRGFSNYTTFGVIELIEITLFVLIVGFSFYLGNSMFPNYGLFGSKKDGNGNILLE